jgi:teichuronic acid biosynthesis glycosyltransferase TuaG
VVLSENIRSVSVIIPVYNAVETIQKSIFSALNQGSFTNECIVVDDCSTDATPEIVNRLADREKRIKYHRMPSNTGSPAGPRNAGISLANGRFIAFLDADDEWLPEKLRKQIEFMERTGAAVSCTGYRVIDGSSDQIGAFRPLLRTSYESLLRHNTVGCSTVVIDTENVGKPEFPLCGHEDYALWLRLARQGIHIHGLVDELGVYRVASGSVSSNKLRVLGFFWNIYRNIERLPIMKSSFYCLRYAWNVRKKYG